MFQYLCPVYSIGLQLSTARIHWSYRKSSPKVLRFLGHDLRQVPYTCFIPLVLIHSLRKARYTTHHNWHFYVSRKWRWKSPMESIRVSSGRESSRGIGQVSTSNLKEKFQMNYEAFSFTWWIHRISPTVSKVRITLQSPFQSGGLNLKPIVLCQCSSNFWFISVVGYVMTILVCSLICTAFSVFANGKEVVCLSLVWFGEADTVLYSSRRVRLFVV